MHRFDLAVQRPGEEGRIDLRRDDGQIENICFLEGQCDLRIAMNQAKDIARRHGYIIDQIHIIGAAL